MRKINLTSIAFEEGQPIPARYTADEQDVSPPLNWTDPPEQAQSFALVCDDPDAPKKTWVHWVAWNVPTEARELAEGVPGEAIRPNGVTQGTNDFNKVGYGGPSPPPGKPHRYFFKLYALDTRLNLQPGASKQQLEEAMRGHVLAEGQLMGTYGRGATPRQ